MSIASSSADVTPRQNNIPAEQNNTLSSSLPQLNNTVSGSNTNSQIGVFRTRATLDRRQSLELIKTNIKSLAVRLELQKKVSLMGNSGSKPH